MTILDAVKNIFDKNLDQMKENLNAALAERAIEKLDEKKIGLAQSLFTTKLMDDR